MALANLPLSAGTPYSGHPASRTVAEATDLRCPRCNSPELKKVSLTFREGLYRIQARMRVGGMFLGQAWLGIFAGRANTHGTQQTDLSKALNPPAKCSYITLLLRWFLLTGAAMFAYVVVVSASVPPVSTLPVKVYVFLAPFLFVLLLLVFRRHNRLVYPRQYAEWIIRSSVSDAAPSARTPRPTHRNPKARTLEILLRLTFA
jgi:hypothetical protein